MVVVSAYLVIAPFYAAPLQSFYCILFVFAAIPFYLVFVRYKVVPRHFLLFVGKYLCIVLKTDESFRHNPLIRFLTIQLETQFV